MEGIRIDMDLLREFERGLDPIHPEMSAIPARILGYGEISTVFEIEGLEGWALKRMPIFRTWEELEHYKGIYFEYHRILVEQVGLRLPAHDGVWFQTDDGQILFYIVQKKYPADDVGNAAVNLLSEEGVLSLVEGVLQELGKVWDYNAGSSGIEVGIDGQISNWALEGWDHDRDGLGEGVSLVYLDTSTPLFRVEGKEQINPELFLRSAPSFLVWVLKWLFLQDVIDRYYDFHRVVVDLIANFHKEQRPQLIPDLVRAANSFFHERVQGLGVEPITVSEVRSYYREDAWIWRLYLAFRRLDRFLHRTILCRPYPFILPGRIKR